MVGQVSHQLGSQSAQLIYLLAGEDDDLSNVTELLEEMTRASATWGAFSLMCELDTLSPFLEAFRRIDFNVWAKQRFWQLDPARITSEKSEHCWRVWNSCDINAMRALHQSLVPKIFHNLEPLTRRAMLGLVYTDAHGDLKGYVDLVYGPKGIWALPIIHPGTADDPQVISDMLACLPSPGKRPVSICVRSYQPWLDDLMQQLDATCSPEQVLMVKYMALRQKVSNALELPDLKNSRADTSLPVAHIEQKSTSNPSGLQQ